MKMRVVAYYSENLEVSTRFDDQRMMFGLTHSP